MRTARASVCTGLAALTLSLLAGCDKTVDPGPWEKTAATAWTVSGTITFPASETATSVHLVADTDVNGGAGTYFSPAVPLTLAGSPPTASFTLPIDVAGLDDWLLTVHVFDDTDGDDLCGASESYSALKPVDATDGVWGDGTDFAAAAAFLHKTSGEGVQPGWYRLQGSVSTLITTDDAELTGAKLVFFNSDPLPLKQ